MPDRVTAPVYARELDRLMAELGATERAVYDAFQRTRDFALECQEAGQHAARSGELPLQRWLDEARDAVEAAGRRLRGVARGGRTRERRRV